MNKLLSFSVLILLAGCMVRPSVISTNPKNGEVYVNSDLKNISVTFSKSMKDKVWSWVKDITGEFPKLTGEPSYDEQKRTNTLPVKLEPGKTYVLWINSAQFQNFQDEGGVVVKPYKLTFTTKD